MNYRKIHDAIIEHAKNNPVIEGEKHHIHPRSLGGSNSVDNVIKLTYRQHFIVHKLLVRLTEGEDRLKMMCALTRFIHSPHHQITSREYAKIRRDHKIAVSALLKGIPKSEETRMKMSESQKQRYAKNPTHWRNRKHTDDTRAKMSKSQSAENNPQFGKPRSLEERAAISMKLKGVKKTAETRQRMKEAQKLAWEKRRKHD